ncbi:glycosyltransferase [Peribacillus glennii]|uniref:Glycosyltransferase family 2 protein n=1 Tax=Peribacillus glennii TaxID=2303991 RepID=A0A372LBY7_9BACI|nr:glycosyltransferase [Peribacillus glennii]RFU62970.1 glycosyltransferase family 2 protein [Peribacillus glennii]
MMILNLNERRNVMVSIITCTKRPQFIDNVFENYQAQEWKDKELIVILNNDEMNLGEWSAKAQLYENTTVYQLPETTSLGACLNLGIEKSKYDYIAKFDDDDYYSPSFLTEALDALLKTQSDVVGKLSSYMFFEDKQLITVHMPGYENMYLPKDQNLKGGTLVFRKAVYQKVKFLDLNCDEDDHFTEDCRRHGFKLYVTDKNHFAYIRRDNPNHHTWKQEFDQIIKHCSELIPTTDYKRIVSP